MKGKRPHDSFFLFDLDGTILDDELLPKVAEELMPEIDMRNLTRLAASGEVPYETSLRHRINKLSSLPVKQVQEICLDASINKDILDFIRKRKGSCAIASSNLDVWIRPLIERRIGIPFFASSASVANGVVNGVQSILDKGDVVSQLRRKSLFCIAVGDGHNDQAMLDSADIGIAFSQLRMPAPSLYDVADYIVCDSEPLCRLLQLL